MRSDDCGSADRSGAFRWYRSPSHRAPADGRGPPGSCRRIRTCRPHARLATSTSAVLSSASRVSHSRHPLKARMATQISTTNPAAQSGRRVLPSSPRPVVIRFAPNPAQTFYFRLNGLLRHPRRLRGVSTRPERIPDISNSYRWTMLTTPAATRGAGAHYSSVKPTRSVTW
jgi:hypothetical protein